MDLETASLTGCTRVDDLWFSDGSLVVRAENSIFRVSGAILAARSSVFQDMLSFPQPGSEGAGEILNLDGTPVVELHDLAAEVEPFLRAIFDSSFFMPPPSFPQLSDILAIVRLSHKYDISYLHLRALNHLSTTYPTELPIFLEHLNSFPAGFEKLKPSADAHLQVLSVLHEVNAAVAPPRRLRTRLSMPSFQIFCSSIMEHPSRPYQAQAAPRECTRRAAHRCDRARRRRRSHARLYRPGKVGQIEMEFNFFDVKDIFLPGVWEDLGAPMCGECMKQRTDQVLVAMKRVWDGLPINLGLPPWEELREMRDAVVV
ncbi:BTB domain-containing protein [Mycena sanguinolenta]|uniref:BTB domain-containing protein n=1 Tax=Mycena sanguinolenta TaxID=230812 RepID=A0A8H7D6I4_9AGAR|nr:BTB domain-containing protein [Mycena sanguinolenta]